MVTSSTPTRSPSDERSQEGGRPNDRRDIDWRPTGRRRDRRSSPSRSPTRSRASCSRCGRSPARPTVGQAISLLLLEISQVLLAGARLGAQRDFTPRDRVPARRRARGRPRRAAAAAGRDARQRRHLQLRLRPLRPRGGREPALRRPDQHRQRPRERPAPLPRRRRRRGAVVVAVLLRLLLGQPRRARRSTRCCRWSPTTGSTPTSRTRSSRSRSPRRCWRPTRPTRAPVESSASPDPPFEHECRSEPGGHCRAEVRRLVGRRRHRHQARRPADRRHPQGAVTTWSWSSPRWATPPTSCATSPSR